MLEAENIQLRYRENTVLSAIYFKANKGEITGLLGRNGSGKTSLLKIIFGNIQPQEKLIQIDKQVILKPLYKTKKIAYLPQHEFCPKNLKVTQVFKSFNLDFDDFIYHFPFIAVNRFASVNELSGGEKRILETYMILKSKADYILLDEPFSQIMPLYIDKIKKLILDTKKEKAIIITDHLYQNILELSDSLYLIHNKTSVLIKEHNQLEDYGYLNYGSL